MKPNTRISVYPRAVNVYNILELTLIVNADRLSKKTIHENGQSLRGKAKHDLTLEYLIKGDHIKV